MKTVQLAVLTSCIMRHAYININCNDKCMSFLIKKIIIIKLHHFLQYHVPQNKAFLCIFACYKSEIFLYFAQFSCLTCCTCSWYMLYCTSQIPVLAFYVQHSPNSCHSSLLLHPSHNVWKRSDIWNRFIPTLYHFMQ